MLKTFGNQWKQLIATRTSLRLKIKKTQGKLQ